MFTGDPGSVVTGPKPCGQQGVSVAPGPRTVSTVCTYCAVGCGMVLTVDADPVTGGDRVHRCRGDKAHPANFGRLCTKGATTADLLATGGRMTAAQLRPAPR